MKKILGAGFLLFICAAGWEIGGRLSTDALGLALGVLFGVMAGVPAALIALTASRRNESMMQQPRYEPQNGMTPRNFAQHQPPVIILAGAPMQQQLQGQQGWHGQQQGMQYPAHYQQNQPQYNVVDSYAYPVGQQAAQQTGRQFKLVGEKEEMIEDW